MNNKSNKLLYIGKKIINPCSGGEQINLRNQILLEEIYGEEITYIDSISMSLYAKLCGGITNLMIKKIRRELASGEYGVVFLSHSFFGRIARDIRNKFPDIKVITFFHNIELHYAKEYMRIKGLKTLPFLLTTKYWEKICVDNSDYLITLNARDSRLLELYYGRYSNIILPTSFQDKYDESKRILIENKNKDLPIDYLFVGTSFFANVQGVQWFINNVMPHADGHFWVIGNGMDKIAFSNVTDKIHILGYVESLEDYYYSARMIISPIFSGAGMKTKTAEALMYGKRILGSKEAYEGYEVCDTMHECNTSEEFIQVIKRIGDNPQRYFVLSRRLFVTNYSITSIKNKFIKWYNMNVTE